MWLYNVHCNQVLNKQKLTCNIFYLIECLAEENLFYVVSPKDIIVSKMRDEDDHVTWLVEHEQYEVKKGLLLISRPGLSYRLV